MLKNGLHIVWIMSLRGNRGYTCLTWVLNLHSHGIKGNWHLHQHNCGHCFYLITDSDKWWRMWATTQQFCPFSAKQRGTQERSTAVACLYVPAHKLVCTFWGSLQFIRQYADSFPSVVVRNVLGLRLHSYLLLVHIYGYYFVPKGMN